MQHAIRPRRKPALVVANLGDLAASTWSFFFLAAPMATHSGARLTSTGFFPDETPMNVDSAVKVLPFGP